MAIQERLYTVEDLWEISHKEDSKRFELDEGEIIAMSPAGDKHSAVVGELFRLIANYVVEHDLGDVSAPETGFILKPNTVRAPDVGFLAKERLTPMTGQYYPIAPDLAVEVVSPSDTRRRIHRKVSQYLHAGTRTVWVVYPDDHLIDIYRPDGSLTTLSQEGDVLDGGDALPGFMVTLREVFQRVRD